MFPWEEREKLSYRNRHAGVGGGGGGVEAEREKPENKNGVGGFLERAQLPEHGDVGKLPGFQQAEREVGGSRLEAPWAGWRLWETV